nr:glycosyltransferase [Micromonospora sp. DSM 115978]
MSSRGTPKRLRRWRIAVGDRPRLGLPHHWPASMWGAGLARVPRRPGAAVPVGGDVVATRTVVVAQSVAWLRHLLDDPASLPKTRKVRVVVQSWRNPHRSWSGRLGPLPHLLSHRARMPRRDAGRVVIDVELRWSVPLRAVIAAVLPVLTPVRPVPAPVSADVTAQDVVPGWLGTRPNSQVITGELPGNDDIRPHDIVLAPTTVGPEVAGLVLAADPVGAGPVGRPEIAMVDIEFATARRRYGPFGPAAGRAVLTFPDEAGGGWRIAGPAGELVVGRLDRPWPVERVAGALAGIGTVSCPSLPGRRPVAEVSVLLRLALAGVLVHSPGLSASSRAHLTDEVAELFGAPLPDGSAPELDWEVRTVAQRRAVLRGHGTAFALPRIATAGFPAIPELPSVSALLVTKRLEHVRAAFTAIEAQRYPNLEIILCLHGVDAPAEIRDLAAGSARPVELLTLPAGHGFGEALGVATARARGSLVTKFDDDDSYGPEHVWDLVLARHYSGAELVGKAAEFVHLESLGTTVRRDAGAAEAFTPVVAGGTMLIGRGDLERVGGWRPVPRSVDRGLLDRVRRAGGLIYRTHPLGYIYHRRDGGHTWDPGLEYFLRGGDRQWPGLPDHPEFGLRRPAGGAQPTGGRTPGDVDGSIAAAAAAVWGD